MSIFATTATHLLVTVTDLKHMARYSDYLLNTNLGLKKLAKLLQVNGIRTAHFAGSESLLTRSVGICTAHFAGSESLLTRSVYDKM